MTRIRPDGLLLAALLAVAGPGAFAPAFATAEGSARSAGVREVAGFSFPERVRVGDRTLILRSATLVRYKLLFKGIAAALYLEEGVSAAAALDDVPRRLEIGYFWPIGADHFRGATAEGIARNVSPELLGRLRDRIEGFNALYRDVEPGDRYALTYLPGHGTELALNGEVLGRIEGADFAAALFAIWLGERPVDAGLRARLLEIE